MTLQALKDCCRFLCFETDVEGFEVATHGGTLFVVEWEGVPYAITAKHNLHDFHWQDLTVTKTRTSTFLAGLTAVYYASQGTGAAQGSDILDIAVVQFTSDVTSAFFEGTAFELREAHVRRSAPGEALTAYGALKEFSTIGDKLITPQFADLGFVDKAPHPYDPALREAEGQWLHSDISDLAGLSGAPVYNNTQDGLCGMVVRGGINQDGLARMHYVEMCDILRLLRAVHEGRSSDGYVKSVAHPN